jgi:hypothetical protein
MMPIAQPVSAPYPQVSYQMGDNRPWTTGTARLAEPYYEAGLVWGQNGPLGSSGQLGYLGLTGVRVLENYGYLARYTVGMLLALLQGMSRTSCGPGGHCYTRPVSDAEAERDYQALKAAVSGDYIMELTVYTPGIFGTVPNRSYAEGFEYYLGGTITVGSIRHLPAALQIAFSTGYLAAHNVPFRNGQGPHPDSPSTSDRHFESIYYSNAGIMLRLTLPINRFLEVLTQWDANMFSFWDTNKRYRDSGRTWSSPLRVGVLLNATDRIFARAIGSLNGFGAYGLGSWLEAGVRF